MVGSYKWYWWFLSFFLASCLSEGCNVTVTESGKERQFSVKGLPYEMGVRKFRVAEFVTSQLVIICFAL